MVKTDFVKIFKSRQQKGRRVPNNLKEIVDQEIKNLIDEDHTHKPEK